MPLKIVHSTITDRDREVEELSRILVTKWRATAKKRSEQEKLRSKAIKIRS